MADAEQLVRLDIDGRVATLTLNRPDKLNALNDELLHAFDQRVAEVAANPLVRSVVLTGAGRAFCAGFDLSGSTTPRSPVTIRESYERMSGRMLALREMPQPIIAAVHGWCLGRGFELALWCDLVVAAEDARFGEPEIRDGSFVASILPWLTTPQRAKLVMLTGDTFTAREAHELGLVARVVASGEALATATDLAGRIAHVPAPAARAVKRYVDAATEARGLRDGQRSGSLESAHLASLTPEDLGTEDLARIRRERGLKAYLEARNAPFEPG